MSRKIAHNEKREPVLESILSNLRYRKIIKHITNGSKVLDLGCGYNAGFLKKIQSKNCKCTGMDVSVNKELHLANVTLIEYDLNEGLPFVDNTFDYVTSLANLEHLTNPEAVMSEVYRVIKPGGILLLTTPSVYARPVLEFLSFKLHLISENEIKDHKNYFNKDTLVNLCKKVGWGNIKHRYFQFFMNNCILASKKLNNN
jgi:ubiquinone/menaquinone biosynthesis C-methylase UbiE